MSQRDSGYQRKRNDAYQTPRWVTEILCKHLPEKVTTVWEPAAGAGQIVRELRRNGFRVRGTDVENGFDFLSIAAVRNTSAIVTNPPFKKAEQFIAHALNLMKPVRGVVAMLTRIDYDSASTRRYLFADHRAFAMKIVLTKRIVWFERKGAAPSFNHAWLIWNWEHRGSPTITYGP